MRRGLAAIAAAAVALAAWIAVRDLTRHYWTTRGARVERFTLHTAFVPQDLHEIRVVPKRHAAWTLVLLHGRSSTPASWLNQTFFDALHSLGARAPVVLLLDGGDHSYWHDRAGGHWGAAVLSQLHGRVAIGGHSPALWFHAADTPAGAFDDAADFARNDLLAHPPHYRAPVWIDVGTRDPFRAAAVAYAHEIHAQLHVWPGGHEGSYWRAHMRSYLRFYAAQCS